jgi:hypothetical protein
MADNRKVRFIGSLSGSSLETFVKLQMVLIPGKPFMIFSEPSRVARAESILVDTG